VVKVKQASCNSIWLLNCVYACRMVAKWQTVCPFVIEWQVLRTLVSRSELVDIYVHGLFMLATLSFTSGYLTAGLCWELALSDCISAMFCRRPTQNFVLFAEEQKLSVQTVLSSHFVGHDMQKILLVTLPLVLDSCYFLIWIFNGELFPQRGGKLGKVKRKLTLLIINSLTYKLVLLTDNPLSLKKHYWKLLLKC